MFSLSAEALPIFSCTPTSFLRSSRLTSWFERGLPLKRSTRINVYLPGTRLNLIHSPYRRQRWKWGTNWPFTCWTCCSLFVHDLCPVKKEVATKKEAYYIRRPVSFGKGNLLKESQRSPMGRLHFDHFATSIWRRLKGDAPFNLILKNLCLVSTLGLWWKKSLGKVWAMVMVTINKFLLYYKSVFVTRI